MTTATDVVSRAVKDDEIDSASDTAVDEAFLSTATQRQPVDALGPRARRTINRIVDATRDVLLSRGYAGTTIDEIARVADVSRASFYTYFPSKREVLLAVGEQSARQGLGVVEQLGGRATTRAGLEAWVAEYFDFLDVHGSFSFAWTQVARQDDELRVPGMRRHLMICRRFGEILAAGSMVGSDEATVIGLTAMSTLERAWNFGALYAGEIDRDAIIAASARSIWGLTHPRRGPLAS